jgi:protein-tyrosine phosphatase
MNPKLRILFVCMGNICRSPAAEGVFQRQLEESCLAGQVLLDSAGTGGWHSGNRADSRMRTAAARRDYDLTSRARQVSSSDFEAFDLILAMDRDNLRDLEALNKRTSGKAELKLFCDYCTDHDETEVPDPYYGGEAGFEKVLDLLEDGCNGLLADVQARLGTP